VFKNRINKGKSKIIINFFSKREKVIKKIITFGNSKKKHKKQLKDLKTKYKKIIL